VQRLKSQFKKLQKRGGSKGFAIYVVLSLRKKIKKLTDDVFVLNFLVSIVVSIEILISSPLLSTVGLFNAAVRHPAVCGTDIDVKILSTDLDAYNMMTHSTQ